MFVLSRYGGAQARIEKTASHEIFFLPPYSFFKGTARVSIRPCPPPLAMLKGRNTEQTNKVARQPFDIEIGEMESSLLEHATPHLD